MPLPATPGTAVQTRTRAGAESIFCQPGCGTQCWCCNQTQIDMASLTSNPMEEMMEEEEYQDSNNKNISSAGGYRRSWSNPGPEPDMNRPNTLRLCSGNNSTVLL